MDGVDVVLVNIQESGLKAKVLADKTNSLSNIPSTDEVTEQDILGEITYHH